MDTNKSGNTTNRVHLNAHIGVYMSSDSLLRSVYANCYISVLAYCIWSSCNFFGTVFNGCIYSIHTYNLKVLCAFMHYIRAQRYIAVITRDVLCTHQHNAIG